MVLHVRFEGGGTLTKAANVFSARVLPKFDVFVSEGLLAAAMIGERGHRAISYEKPETCPGKESRSSGSAAR